MNGKGERDWIWIKAETTVRRQKLTALFQSPLHCLRSTHNIVYFPDTWVLSRPKFHPKAINWGKASLQNIQVYEKVSGHIIFLFSIFNKRFARQQTSSNILTSVITQLTDNGSAKTPKEILARLDQPEPRTAGGPRSGHAPGRESMLANMKTARCSFLCNIDLNLFPRVQLKILLSNHRNAVTL